MRTYATVRGTFWVRGSGKKLRGNPEAQVLAMYLMTCCQGTMCGLFNIALPTIAHETGLAPERLPELFAEIEEIAKYDPEDELCWVPNAAREQIGEKLAAKDKRRGGLLRELKQFEGHAFHREFIQLYWEAYTLENPSSSQAPPDDAACPMEGASKGYPASLQALGQGQGQGLDQVRGVQGGTGDPEPTRLPTRRADAERIPVQLRCQLALRNPHDADHASPGQWPEVRAVAEAFHAAMGFREPRLGGMGDSGVRAIIERLAEGYTPDELQRAMALAPKQPMFRDGRPKGLASLTAEVVRRLVEGVPKAQGDAAPADEVAAAARRAAEQRKAESKRRARAELLGAQDGALGSAQPPGATKNQKRVLGPLRAEQRGTS